MTTIATRVRDHPINLPQNAPPPSDPCIPCPCPISPSPSHSRVGDSGAAECVRPEPRSAGRCRGAERTAGGALARARAPRRRRRAGRGRTAARGPPYSVTCMYYSKQSGGRGAGTALGNQADGGPRPGRRWALRRMASHARISPPCSPSRLATSRPVSRWASIAGVASKPQ